MTGAVEGARLYRPPWRRAKFAALRSFERFPPIESPMHPVAEDILTFWFGTTDLSAEFERRQVWFRSTPEFDREVAERYTAIHERAAGGAFDRFVESQAECLALVNRPRPVPAQHFPRHAARLRLRRQGARDRPRGSGEGP